jgi:hypothetical protein
MARIDGWSARKTFRWPPTAEQRESAAGYHDWYSDTIGLRVSGMLGFGTELFLLMICSVFNHLELYLYLNVFLMNGIFILCVAYRRFVLSHRYFANKDNG